MDDIDYSKFGKDKTHAYGVIFVAESTAEEWLFDLSKTETEFISH